MTQTNQQISENIFVVSELKNLTSDALLLKGSEWVEVLECDINIVTFQGPTVGASLGQLISLNGHLRISGRPETEFSVVGKISELVNTSSATDRITIKMNQYDKDLWQEFLKNLSAKQTRVDNLLHAMKGDS